MGFILQGLEPPTTSYLLSEAGTLVEFKPRSKAPLAPTGLCPSPEALVQVAGISRGSMSQHAPLDFLPIRGFLQLALRPTDESARRDPSRASSGEASM
jgi:hypothetical protein